MAAGHPKPEVEAIVIGGGPAGAAVACHLARQGRETVLIEQSAVSQHKVCGEFISHEASRYLDDLGLNLERLGAVPIHGVRLSTRRRVAATELPFPAWSLTRRRLDEELLAQAVIDGVQVLRGERVETLENSSGVWSAAFPGGATKRARAAFLATGKHDLRGYRRPRGMHDDFVGFKMYWRLSPLQQRGLHGWVEIFLFTGGYAGLQLTEDFEANLCLLIHRRELRYCDNDWSRILARIMRFSEPLAARLDGATPLLARPLAISSIPFGLLRPNTDIGPWFLGDQAAVIPSFSGDGISIALHSAKVASVLYGNGRTPDLLAQMLNRQLRRPIAFAGVFSKLMTASPDIVALARFWPQSLRIVASQTRIPQVALSLPVQRVHSIEHFT
jgi:menaquinone-9 beta-reductase